MSQIGLLHKKSIQNNYKIDENDVSSQSVGRIDIANILNNIELYEAAIESGGLDHSTIQTLTVALYPKAIEYYSAFDNAMYNDLLNRM